MSRLESQSQQLCKRVCKCLRNWQSSFVFENRFDVSNVGNDCFVDEVIEYFNVDDKNHARTIYNDWRKNPKKPQKDSDFLLTPDTG